MTTTPTQQFLTANGERTAPHSTSEAEQRLWGAVILRAIADAVWVDGEPAGKPGQKISFYGRVVTRGAANRMRDEAAFWLTLDNSGFREVCSNAGLHPENVRRWAEKAMRASDDDKARWATADLSLHDLRTVSELRAGSECA